MSYRENERKKAIEIREALFRDPGAGIFFNREREFVLQDPTLNLWAGIRDDVIQYLKRTGLHGGWEIIRMNPQAIFFHHK